VVTADQRQRRRMLERRGGERRFGGCGERGHVSLPPNSPCGRHSRMRMVRA
jgi:hypothetical protein